MPCYMMHYIQATRICAIQATRIRLYGYTHTCPIQACLAQGMFYRTKNRTNVLVRYSTLNWTFQVNFIVKFITSQWDIWLHAKNKICFLLCIEIWLHAKIEQMFFYCVAKNGYTQKAVFIVKNFTSQWDEFGQKRSFSL